MVVNNDAGRIDYAEFFSALQELVAYAFEESAHLGKKSRVWFSAAVRSIAHIDLRHTA
jgi:hypothetical protein